ncbi:hypothetical protein I215_15320, partial [Galbibacter marinus]
SNMETLTSIVNNGDGTYTYTNEDGVLIDLDANTTSVTSIDGVYTFTDASGTVITSVDTNAKSLGFDNSTNGFTSTNVQDAIDELSQTIEANKGDLIVSEGIEFTGGLDGTNILLADSGIGIADSGISTDKLADGSVTNDKIDTDAITSDKIANREVQAEDLGAAIADQGKVGVVQPDGSIVYQNVDASAVNGNDLTAGDTSITVVDGTGATLVNANVSVAADGITNDKLADNAVNTENITDGAVEPIDLNANVAGAALSQDGDTMALNVNANNGLSISDDNVQLGGVLIEETAITTDVDNTLAIVGLQTGATQDNLVVVDTVSGVLKQTRAAMPKFFYMPSIVFDVSTTGMASRNLHEEYIKQFTGTGNPTLVGSEGAPTDIPNLPNPKDLYYYVTYYDDEIFEAVSISETGIMTYNVKSTSPTEASFMNIVFVVK